MRKLLKSILILGTLVVSAGLIGCSRTSDLSEIDSEYFSIVEDEDGNELLKYECERYSVVFNPEYIEPIDYSKENEIILSFNNDDYKTSGVNTLKFTVLYNTSCEAALNEIAQKNGEKVEFLDLKLGVNCYDGLIYMPKAISETSGGEQVGDTYYAIKDGEDVIFVTRMRSSGTDDDREFIIDAQLSNVTESLSIK